MHDEGLVLRQLKRVLASPAFVRARRSSQLLQFLVESALAGEPDLKEYTIATNVFARPESFDPRIDSVVRVEATRLRDRLHNYYESATEEDPVEISLPIGRYRPEFRLRGAELHGTATRTESAAVPAPPVTPAPTPPRPTARLWLLCLAAMVLGAGAFALYGRLFEARPLRLTLMQHVAIPGKVLLSPVLSPDSKRLYYASNRGGERLRIWRQRLEGNDLEALTSEEWDSFDLDLSPDGSWLAYFSRRDGGAIYQKPAAGGPELLVAPFGRSPRFSPDGSLVLYWVEEPHTGFGKVFVRRVSRKPYPEEPRQIGGEFADAHNPQWLPDGRVLICGTLRTNIKEMEHDLWIVAVSDVRLPLKTGILPYLRARNIEIHGRALKTTSFQLHDGNLIFTGIHSDHTVLYLLPLSAGFQPRGDPIVLSEDADSQESPALRGNLMAFTSARFSLNAWRIPRGKNGQVTAARLTDGPTDAVFPQISNDGGQLVYLALKRPTQQIWKKDLRTGLESELYRSQGISRLIASADGSQAFFRVMQGPPPQPQPIFVVDVKRGEVRKICANCGAPTSISPSGEYVVHETGSAVLRLAVIHVPTGDRMEVLRHPSHGVQGGRISPDGKRIVFELDRGPDGVQLFTAPFHGLNPIPQGEWVPVSDPNASSFEPAWAPDGSSIYFLSERSGSRDLWIQRLQPDGSIHGPALLVHAFHDPQLTPLTYLGLHPRYVGLSISSNDAVLTLAEMHTTLWVGRLSR
jgi:Tol biopolymer transport system component